MHLAEKTAEKIDATIAARKSWRSKRLSPSLLGDICARKVWFIFRWALKQDFEPRMLRLFDRGHREEPVIVALLKEAKIEVWEKDGSGKQYVVLGLDGHLRGKVDGVCRGVPDLSPEEPVLLEVKTHNQKSWDKLEANGVTEEFQSHYAQILMYQHLMGLRWCLYIGVCKNDDSIHWELVPYNPEDYQRFELRSRSIVFSDQPPPKISENPGWWQCKFCPMHGLCHFNDQPEINCRTCGYVTVEKEGKWSCARGNPQAAKDQGGCKEHVFNPYMFSDVEVLSGDKEKNYILIKTPNGAEIKHGPQHVRSFILSDFISKRTPVNNADQPAAKAQ